MMNIESVLVTGANRGIGFEFVRQICQQDEAPKYIFATYRSENTWEDLKALQESSTKSRIILIKMDVTVQEDIEAAKKKIEDTVGDRGLNFILNNAGVSQMAGFPDLTPANMQLHFRANTVAPIMIVQIMYPLLEKAARISCKDGMSASKAAVLNMTSKTGSIKNTGVIFTVDVIVAGYKISKAALNMGMRVIATSVKDKEILIVNMCPGWVKTDMGGRDIAEIEPEESIADVLRMLLKLNETHHGAFIDRFGEEYPF